MIHEDYIIILLCDHMTFCPSVLAEFNTGIVIIGYTDIPISTFVPPEPQESWAMYKSN